MAASSDLVTKARELVSTVATDFMTPEDLHCISNVSQGSDEPYEERWLREEFDSLTLTYIYWTQHKCAILGLSHTSSV